MPPADAHLVRGMRNTAPAKLTRQIFNQAATIIIVQPIFEVMQPLQVIAGALATAIPVHFDEI